jgi:hypothetical protein
VHYNTHYDFRLLEFFDESGDSVFPDTFGEYDRPDPGINGMNVVSDRAAIAHWADCMVFSIRFLVGWKT